MLRSLVLTLAVLAAAPVQAQAPAPAKPSYQRPAAPGERVDIGGRRLHIQCKGSAPGPVVSAGYSAPQPVRVSPGQVITLFVHANGTQPAEAAAAKDLPLPMTLNGYAGWNPRCAANWWRLRCQSPGSW